jgi:hypothetical protein
MFKALLVSSLLALVPPQTAPPIPQNPSQIAFLCADHAIDTDHEVGFFLLGAATPASTLRLGDPAMGVAEVTLNFDSRTLPIANYELRVRAYAGTAVSGWSSPVPFERVLSQPTGLRIVR